MAEEKKCKMCREAVVGQAVSLGDDIYHPACFTCSNCYQQLSGDFKEMAGGRRVCPDCTKKAKCKSCQKEISGISVDIDGDQYHPVCFRCETCQATLGDKYARVK